MHTSRLATPPVLIGLATAFSLLGDQVLYSVLPVYYGALGITPIEVGIVLSANRWVRLLTNELAHRMVTFTNQRALFVGALGLGVVTTVAYVATSYFAVLLGARLAWGLAWSFIRHFGVQSLMQDVAATRVGRTMGVYNGISRAGSVAGLLGGAVLVDLYGFTAGLLMLALVSLLSLPLGARGFRRFETTAAQRTASINNVYLPLGFVLGIVGPGLVVGVLGAVLVPYVATDGWLTAATVTGVLLGVRYLLDSVAAPYLGGLTDRWGVRRASMRFFLLGGSCLAIASLQPGITMLVLGVIGFFVSATALQAGITGTASRLGSASYARFVTASDFGSASGPVIGWLLVDRTGEPGLALAVGAALYLVTALAIGPALIKGAINDRAKK